MSFLCLIRSVELEVPEASQILKVKATKPLVNDLVFPAPFLSLRVKPVIWKHFYICLSNSSSNDEAQTMLHPHEGENVSTDLLMVLF